MVRKGRGTADRPVASGVRSRTRAAIVEAALAVWAREIAAPLTDIAERAGVSRSTLHRYFPERQNLLDAVLMESLRVLDAVVARAADAATPLDRLTTLLRSFVEVGDRVVFLYADPDRFTGNPHWRPVGNRSLRTLIEAAQSDGVLDAALPASWIEAVFNAHIYVAAEAAQAGAEPAHVIADRAVRTLLGGVATSGR
ncbi:TetR/AcrR family transcriptional regulator [Nocardia sp. CDC159]|uniref:TetR/AcrR family transcriptional regulator n=1 Tax=Nocardia pulmonis TaxID=2951408 RepID=A0A9X2E0P0_9NOCA|nr:MULTISPECIES: TetR/AcrR family transcriptional regulator [Nocardia]MCM6771959.1 TetR/AcrR family transcriptional regulator [Nocardia pulmonis]MCM6785383.1 TetR/AcrR family transcriptional regulator [Nocardia sp. CDC159]